MVSNIGAPTHEGSLLRLNISSILLMKEKEHSIQRHLTGLISHPLGGATSSNRNITSSGVNIG